MTQSNEKPKDRPSPTEEARRLYEESEARTAKAFEELVNRDSFGELLAKVTENAVALTRITNESLDLVLRNLRVAGRTDLIRVGRQLARTEDKLELVLQEVERLREDVKSSGQGGDSHGERQRAVASGSQSKSTANSQGAGKSEGAKA